MGSTPTKIMVTTTKNEPAIPFVSYRRRAHHAGSWYTDDADTLRAGLEHSLQAAAADDTTTTTSSSSVRALVCPHAGYSYSGPTAAHSYHALQNELQRRHQTAAAAAAAGDNAATTTTTTSATTIVVLHPSHHVYLKGCAVSGATVLETPVGDLNVNGALRQEILHLQQQSSSSSLLFRVMTQEEDEHEHSGEMQYPFVRHVIPAGMMSVTVLPVMCGALNTSSEAAVGKLLAPILARPNVITIVSTDFCHWGKRFAYQPMPTTTLNSNNNNNNNNSKATPMPVHQFIRQMDQRGMELIAQDWQRPGAFAEYLRQTQNTICGRHAVAVWLQALAATYPRHAVVANSSNMPQITFVKYAQSSAVQTMRDSSVSYAAAVCTLEEE